MTWNLDISCQENRICKTWEGTVCVTDWVLVLSFIQLPSFLGHLLVCSVGEGHFDSKSWSDGMKNYWRYSNDKMKFMI